MLQETSQGLPPLLQVRNLPHMSHVRLANFFQDRSIFSPAEWESHVAQAAAGQKEVVHHLVDTGVITSVLGYEAIADQHRWTFQALVDIGANSETSNLIDVDPEVIDLLDADTARSLNALPISMTADEVTVALFDLGDVNVDKQLRGFLGRRVRKVFSPPDQLNFAIGHYYSDTAQAIKSGKTAAEHVQSGPGSGIEVRDINEEVAPVNTLLRNIIDGAMSTGSSNVFIDPTEGYLQVRYGYGRKLQEQPQHPISVAERLINLIKTNAKLDPTALLDQNGTMEHVHKGRKADIRVAVLPAQWGESITLRVATNTIRKLETLGLSPQALSRWEEGLGQANGMNIACGPMNSGKTTLNMASLERFRLEGTRKIVSLEDPVEVKLPSGITQVSIDESKGLTWERAMGTVLRSSASVLFLGEINRDNIAHAAMQASGTGHLVLSTLHTNDAPGVVLRLREMGIKPSVMAENLRTVCAQRLPDMLCKCKVPTMPTERQIRDFELTPEDINGVEWFGPSPKGCEHCRFTSYSGSIAIHEVMTFPEEIRDLIIESAPTRDIAAAARRNGMKTLKEDGLEKAKAGLTSLQELRSQLLID